MLWFSIASWFVSSCNTRFAYLKERRNCSHSCCEGKEQFESDRGTLSLGEVINDNEIQYFYFSQL